ncbi:MAG: hypothetical protein H7Y15_12875 [Pseudonocardia sp.]|nr:hypothetical protein [Pseudonocardia sp.]
MNNPIDIAVHRMMAQNPTNDDITTPPIESMDWWPSRADEAQKAVALRPRSRAISRRQVLVGVGLAAVAAVASVTIPRLAEPTYAATPPLLAFDPAITKRATMELLADLADAALGQPIPRGSGSYHYVRTRSWDLRTEMDVRMRPLGSEIRETERETWIADDGSGRLNIIGDDRLMSQVGGLHGPGGLTGDHLVDRPPGRLRAELDARNPSGTTSGWFALMSDLWKRQVVTPVVQSTLLGILSERRDVTIEGTTADRAGRRGLAISVVGGVEPATRVVLVLDEDSGALLDVEMIAIEQSELPVEAPATIAYTMWLHSGYSSSTAERP